MGQRTGIGPVLDAERDRVCRHHPGKGWGRGVGERVGEARLLAVTVFLCVSTAHNMGRDGWTLRHTAIDTRGPTATPDLSAGPKPQDLMAWVETRTAGDPLRVGADNVGDGGGACILPGRLDDEASCFSPLRQKARVARVSEHKVQAQMQAQAQAQSAGASHHDRVEEQVQVQVQVPFHCEGRRVGSAVRRVLHTGP